MIPGKDILFDPFQDFLSKTAFAKKTAWNLPTAWMDELMDAKGVWRVKYDTWLPENTRTKQMTFEKNEARAEYEVYLRHLIALLEASPSVTDDDRKMMNIYIPPHTNTPLPATDEVVGFRVQLYPMHRVAINCFVLSTGLKTKPHGVSDIEFRWGILPEPTEDPEDLPHVEFTTRSPITLDFDATDRGKVLYFTACWVMRNSQKGRWSDIQYTVIP